MQNEKEHTTISPTLSEELYRFGADGNLRMYSYDRLFYSLYGYDGGTTRTYKYSFDLSPQWVNGRLESINFFCPFFCLETKETKVQGCEKKAKKRLRSAKVVKLAQQDEFAAKHIYHKLSQSSRPQTVLCSNSDDFLTLSPSFFFTLCFSMPLAAALGICCGFSQPNDFCQKIDARWHERSPGKRGQVRRIGD